MKFTIDKHEKYVVFKLEEQKLNSLIAPQLKSELVLLNSEGVYNLILDLESIVSSDSSGLSTLLAAHRLCKGVKGSFVVANMSENLFNLLKISQLHDIFHITPSVEEAIDIVFMEEIERELNGDLE